MSGSPKHSTMWLASRLFEELRRERRRQQERERQRRAREEERLRQQRIARAYDAAADALGSIDSSASSFLLSEAGHFAEAECATVMREAAVLATRLEQAEDDSAIADVVTAIHQMGRHLASLQARAHASKLTNDLDAVRARADEIDHLLHTVDSSQAQRFDPVERRRCEQLISRLRGALDTRDLASARQLVSDALASVERHIAAVDARCVEWEQQRAHATTETHRVADRVSAAMVDVVCTRWVGVGLAELAARCDSLLLLAEAGQFEDALQSVVGTEHELERLVAVAQEQQLADERRERVVASMTAVLRDMGFHVQVDTPSHQDARDPSSARVIRTRNLSGESLDAQVTLNGDVYYEVDGFPRPVHITATGDTATTCDEAEAGINALHARLRAEFEIETTELRWAGQDPNRILSQQNALPTGTDAARADRGFL